MFFRANNFNDNSRLKTERLFRLQYTIQALVRSEQELGIAS